MERTARSSRVRFFSIIIALVVTALAACSGPPKLSVENASVEFNEAMKDAAEIFLAIKNDGGTDTLLGAKVSIPGVRAEVHEMRGSFMIISKSLSIPAKSSTRLALGTSHIMLYDLPAMTKVGDRLTLTLLFKRSGEIQVPLEFTKPRPEAGKGKQQGMEGMPGM